MRGSIRHLGWVAGALLVCSVAGNVFLYRMARNYYALAKATSIFPAASERYEAANRALSPKAGMRILLFGDSRVQRWEPMPRANGAELVNRGIDGQTTAQMRLRFEQDVIALDPDIVVLQLGINDLVGIGVMPGREAAIAETCATNVEYFVAQLAARKVRVVLLTIIPADRPGLLRRPVWNDRIDAEVERLNSDRLSRLASVGVGVVDTRTLLKSDGAQPSDLYIDALHLSPAGYARLNDAVEPLLARR